MSESIKSQENAIFEKWKLKRSRFVSDGMVSELEFNRAKRKMLFILKEANDSGTGGWDLRDYIAGKIDNGPRVQTWRNLSRWLYGANKIPSSLDWEDVSKLDFNETKELLKEIIAININKSPGGHTASDSKLWTEGNEDSDFFVSQINLYKSDYTICCGSTPFWFLKNILTGSRNLCISKRGIQYFKHDKFGVIINFFHPEVRVSSNVIFYSLMDFISEIEYAT